MNAAAQSQAAISKEALDWYKQIYAEQAPLREQAADMATKVADAQLESMTLNNGISKDYWDYQKETFRPLEAGIVSDAQAYDTAARRDAEAAGAVADVGSQMSLARQAQTRGQQRMGVNPNSGKALALDSQMGLAEATAKAGAANTARRNVELQGYARKMDAANMGRNLASNQATSAGVALNAGNSASSNAAQPLVQSTQSAQVMGQGFNTALQANQSAGNLYGQVAQLQGQDTGLMGALGQLGGAAIYKYSDETMKTDRKPVDPEISLSAIRKLPDSESWRYREDSPANDGGQVHVGPMAQDVRMSLGDGVAPGGKAIDLVSMNGHLVNAVKALDKKVISLSNSINKKG